MKNYALSILFVICNFFYACLPGKEKMGFVTREKMNLKVANEIVKFISEHNAEGLKRLFSEEVISNELDLENDIIRLFTFCDGQITNYEKVVLGEETKIDHGLNSTTYNTKYRFEINGISYLLYYIYTPKNSFNPKEEGVRTIRIVKERDVNKYFCYWQDMKPGIFIGE